MARARTIVAAVAVLAMMTATIARGTTPVPIDGTLTIVGSDTLSALVLRWISAFRADHPRVVIQLQTPGSASAPIALLEGAADIGLMSRPMSAAEQDSFHRRFGYAPEEIVVAHDAIVVFVHPDNPLTKITRKQLDAIFSSTLACGGRAPIHTWNDLIPGPGISGAPILVTGRNSASGTNEFFRERALCGGTYRPDVVVWPGHGATVAAVAGNEDAIGYAGAGYVNGLVKPLAYARDDNAPAVEPVMENVMDGDYALARTLYFYVNQPPDRSSAPLRAAFLDYVLSDQAQGEVGQEGFLPVTAAERETQKNLIRATIPRP